VSQPVKDRISTGTDRRRRRQAVIKLVMPAGLRVSDQDFWRLCQVNPDLRLERNASGELIVMPPAAPDSGHRNAGITAQLWNWNQKSGLGIDFDSSAGFTLPNTAIRSPDASWMTRARWDALSKQEREKFSHICPDFVVELRSKNDDMSTLRRRMEEYIAQGIKLGWLIDPKGGTVEIYRPGQPVEVLERPATLSGEDVLPGFMLDLKGILFD
jgi:Uma2 family endonuclease